MQNQRKPTKIEHLDNLECLCTNGGNVMWKLIKKFRLFRSRQILVDIVCLQCGASELLSPCKELVIELKHKFNKETK